MRAQRQTALKNYYYEQSYPNVVVQYPKIKRKKTKQKKKNPFIFALAAFIFASYGYYVCPYNYENYFKPLYLNRFLNRGIKFDADKYINPTSAYLNNSHLLNNSLLVKAKENPKDFAQIQMLGQFEDTKTKLLDLFAKYPRLNPAVFVWEYTSGKGIEINADEIYPAASIIKLPIAFELMRMIDSSNKTDNPIYLYDKRKFKEEFRTLGSGKLQYTKADVEYSLDYLTEIMIANSDNSASNMLLYEIGGMDGLNRAMRNAGLKITSMKQWLPDLEGQNITTAKELSTIMYNINNPSYVPKKYRNVLREYLRKTKTRLLNGTLPENVEIIHKTGNIADMIGDCGIIYLPNGKQYIVTILVKRPKNDYAGKALIQEASKIIYDDMISSK